MKPTNAAVAALMMPEEKLARALLLGKEADHFLPDMGYLGLA